MVGSDFDVEDVLDIFTLLSDVGKNDTDDVVGTELVSVASGINEGTVVSSLGDDPGRLPSVLEITFVEVSLAGADAVVVSVVKYVAEEALGRVGVVK